MLALSFLLGTCLSSLWSPPFPLLALISPTLAKVRLSLTLTLLLHDLVLWTDGSVPFTSSESGSSVLTNCSLYGTEATCFFSAGSVCSSFSAEACAILQALCWTRQHQQVCHFSYLTLVLSSSPSPLFHRSFYLNFSGRSGKNCLLSLSVLSGYNGPPDTCFSRGTTRLMS